MKCGGGGARWVQSSANCYRNSRLVVDEEDLKWVANRGNILLLLKQLLENAGSKTPQLKWLSYVEVR